MNSITLKFDNDGGAEGIEQILEAVSKFASRNLGIRISIYDRNRIYSYGTRFDITDEGLVEDESAYWNKDVYAEIHSDKAQIEPGDPNFTPQNVVKQTTPFSSLEEAFASLGSSR